MRDSKQLWLIVSGYCRENTELSLPKIGKAFGGRDHTTVIHAVDKIKTLMRSDKQVFDEVSQLGQKLRTT